MTHLPLSSPLLARGAVALVAMSFLMPHAAAQGAQPVASTAQTAEVETPAVKAASGKSLVVPAELAKKGTVYYALPGRDRQIYFESDAPLEQIKGQSNATIGYFVSGASDARGRLAGAEWHVPVTSLKTGIALRDEHLASSDWLDAERHPDIVVRIDAVREVKLEKRGESFETYSGTAVGVVTLHGVSRPLELVGAGLTFLKESAATAKVAKGDLASVRAAFSVKLSDFGVENSVIGSKVADVVTLEVALYMSTVPPEQQ